jgi:hypothetical protein
MNPGGPLHHLELLVKPQNFLLKENVPHHWVSLRHVYPQIKDAGLPLLPVAFTRLAQEWLSAGAPARFCRWPDAA